MAEVTRYVAETRRGEFHTEQLVRKLLALRDAIDTVVLALDATKAEPVAELQDSTPEASSVHTSLMEAVAANTAALAHLDRGRVADQPQDVQTSDVREERKNTGLAPNKGLASADARDVGGIRDLSATSAALVMDLHRYKQARSSPSASDTPSRTRHEQFAAKIAACIIGVFAATIVMSTLLSTAEGTDSAEYVRDHSPALERVVPVGRYREIWPSGS